LGTDQGVYLNMEPDSFGGYSLSLHSLSCRGEAQK
jgi:hypothetical protein